MRALLHKARAAWCTLTGRCETPAMDLGDLKDGDPVFASHMDWMQRKEHAAIERRARRHDQDNPVERIYLKGRRHVD